MSLGQRFGHPFERWMDYALRKDVDFSSQRSRAPTSRGSTQKPSQRTQKAHQAIKSAPKPRKLGNTSINRNQPKSEFSRSEGSYAPSKSRETDSMWPTQRMDRGWMAPYGGQSFFQPSPWFASQWNPFDNQSYPYAESRYGRRNEPMQEETEEAETEEFFEDDMEPRRDIMAALDEDFQENALEGMNWTGEDPMAMMEDYFENRIRAPSMIRRMTAPDMYRWKQNDEGQLVLTTKLPMDMKSSDVQLDLENGMLHLKASKSHKEKRKLRGSNASSYHTSEMVVEHKWPLDPALKESDVSAKLDKDEGLLEIVINAPENSALKRSLERAKSYSSSEDSEQGWFGAVAEKFANIPIFGASSPRKVGSQKQPTEKDQMKVDIDTAEEEGMVQKVKEHAEDAVEGSKSAIAGAGEKVKEMGAKAKDMVSEAGEKIKEKASDAVESAKEAFGSAKETAEKSAKDAFDGKGQFGRISPLKKTASKQPADQPQVPNVHDM